MTRTDAPLAPLFAWELPVVATLVGASMATSSVLPLAAAAIALFALARALRIGLSRGQLRIIRTPADLSILILCATLCLSLWVTIQPDVTLTQALRLVAGIGLFYAIVNYRPQSRASATSSLAFGYSRHVLLLFSITGLALALSSPLVVEWSGQSKLGLVPAEIYRNFKLAVADGINPNVLAGALVILSPIPLSGLLFGEPSAAWAKCVNAVSIVAIFLALVLASSRSALAAFCLSAGLLLLLRWPRATTALGIILVLVAAFIGLSALQPGALPVTTAETGQGIFGGLLERSEIWMRGQYIVQDFPLTGVGMGNFARVADLLYPPVMTRPGIEHAHNLMLQVAVDLGLPGLIAWLATFGLIVTGLFIVIRASRKKARADLALACGLLCSQVALIIHGMTDAVTWGMVRSAPLVWALWGVSMAMWLAADPRKGNSPGD